jgi:hypothetical protein
MSRRYILVTSGTFLAIIGILATVLLLLVRYEPRWYKQATPASARERHDESQKFSEEFWGMISAINSDHEWEATFTDAQINSYLDEGFKQQGLATRLLPEEISDPRIVIEPDRLHLAFRYRWGALNTIVSIDFSVWLAPGEPNVVALELVGFHVGALPISVQSLLEDVAKVIRDHGIEMNWYRHPETGKPVAVLRFQKDDRPTMQLQMVRLEQGAITLRGKNTDGTVAQSPEQILNSLFAALVQPR